MHFPFLLSFFSHFGLTYTAVIMESNQANKLFDEFLPNKIFLF